MNRNEGFEERIAAARQTMHCNFDEYGQSDQEKKLPQPPLFKARMTQDAPIALSRDFRAVLRETDYLTVLEERRSCWRFADEEMTLEQLAFLLWSAQGVQRATRARTQRPTPSGGARHPFETYVAARRVRGLAQGLYHYLPETHELELLRPLEVWDPPITESLMGQAHHAAGAAVVYWACVAYRGEWRYSICSHRVMLMDVGHLCQNFYLSATAAGLAACGIAAYDQKACDALLGLDGVEEFMTYCASVGVRYVEQ